MTGREQPPADRHEWEEPTAPAPSSDQLGLPTRPDHALAAAMAAGRDGMVGRTVGHYRVERKLGEGGMGEVYLVRHRDLPDTVAALKVLSRGASDQAAKERFRQEALIASALGGERVVKPIDVGQLDDGMPYIVMD